MRRARLSIRAPVLCATLLICVCACLGAQLSFRHYGQAEGLGDLAILSLAQDLRGFIWVGTEGGLYRYDGASFRLMGPTDGLPCVSEVHALHMSRDGGLWAETCNSVYRFNGRRFYAAAGVTEMEAGAETLADSADGGVLASTRRGLLELRGDGDSVPMFARTHTPGLDASRTKADAVFRFGSELWFGCGGGLCKEERGRVTAFGEAQGLPSDAWTGIGATPDGTLWARSSTKLFFKAPGAARFRAESADLAPSMYWGALSTSADGKLLVPTDRGLAIRENGVWSVVDEASGLQSSLTVVALVDRDGSLWVGMAGGGLARCLGWKEWEGWTKDDGLASDLVWNILRDRRGSVWVATSMGITRLPGPSPLRTWTRKDGLGGENIRWLGEAADGAIWAIARPGGLSRIDPVRGTVRPIRGEDGLNCEAVDRGLVDREGRLWIAGNCGLFRNDAPASGGRFRKVNPEGAMRRGAWALAQDTRGTIYATAVDGLWRLGSSGWRRYTKADGLLDDNPYIMAAAPDGSVWLRHRYDGAVEKVEFEGDRLVRSTAMAPVESASTNLTTFHGFDARGGFWRGTAEGVSVLRNGVWTQYSAEDGLIWNDTDGEAFWADSDGSVWIGTSGGLSHFRPPAAGAAPPVAEPIVSSFAITRKPRTARVSFSTLNYRYEQLARFEYRLDGAAWVQAPDRSVSIAGIGPGSHRLEIRSRIRGGPWSSETAAVEFSADPLWWESWWFRVCALAAIAAAVVGCVRWRQRTLVRRNATLEQAVSERTAELEAEKVKVIEEKRRADAASEAKGRFLANMSHEIRTPLNGVLGLSALLEATDDRAEMRETIRLIRSSGQALLRVINDVLDFSKMDAAGLSLECVPFRLCNCLEESVHLFQAGATAKGIALELSLSQDLPGWVSGDEVRLRQVIMNLVANALKFTAEGGIAVSAALASEDEASHVIRIEVRDTGIGIPEDRKAALFAPFSQADSSISRRYGGTGLGLAISKSLVDLMGGTIGVESREGVGSTFHFTVRVARQDAPVETDAVREAGAPARPLRVLLAEDNAINQKIALKQLERLGVEGDLATDGREAVEVALRKDYDLILMDVQMPELDGIAATQEIRTRLGVSRQPLICGLSAHATDEFRELSRRGGMDCYLTKPLALEQLQKLLSDAARHGNAEAFDSARAAPAGGAEPQQAVQICELVEKCEECS